MGAAVPSQNGGIRSKVPCVFGVTFTTVLVDVAVHPVPTVTKNVPLPLTVMLCPLAPVLQVLPETAEEVRTTAPPRQKARGPEGDIVGVGGVVVTFTTVATELRD